VNAVGTKIKSAGKPKSSPKRSPKFQPTSQKNNAAPAGNQTPRGASGLRKKQEDSSSTILCTWFCGTRHTRGQDNCPAYEAVCTKCGGWNHFEEVCRRPPWSSSWQPRSKQSAQNHRRLQVAYHETDAAHELEEEYKEANAVGYSEILRAQGKERKNTLLVSPRLRFVKSKSHRRH
jgi:predicted  nucleic acid-binding Zn-ribbon protein